MKMSASFLYLFAFTLSVVVAAPNTNFQFSPSTYFPGSWKLTKEYYESENADKYKVEYYANLNITLENDKELHFKYYNNETNEVDKNLSFVSSIINEETMTFPSYVDVYMNKVINLHFQTLVANSSYVFIF